MDSYPISYSNGSSELNTPSPTQDRSAPSIMSNNVPLSKLIYPKCSIHYQDAQASISDATDFLRLISGKIKWFERKQQFCPHLVSNEDTKQIAALHQKTLIEEIPFLELQDRLLNGKVVDIPRDLKGKISNVCAMFNELKCRMDNLLANSPPIQLT